MDSINVRNAMQYVNENKEYLTGYKNVGSEVGNADKYGHLFRSTQYDSFEKTVEMKEIRSENYLDFTKIKSMPKSIFGDKFGKEMQDEIQKCMSDYYAGQKVVADVENAFRKCCVAMRVYRAQNLETSGYNEVDNVQIVGQIFEMFSKCNQRAALEANRMEGIEINRKFGGDSCGNDNLGYAYYNSSYYHECVNMRDIFRNMTVEMQKEWELPQIDVEEIEENTLYTLDGGLDFNSGWNYKYRNNVGIGSMIDEGKIPPENFRLFFNPTGGGTEFSGILRFETNNVFIEMEVPFKYEGNDIYNVSELIKVEGKDITSQDEINEFLKNFEIFTRTQGAVSSRITWVKGNYQAKVFY